MMFTVLSRTHLIYFIYGVLNGSYNLFKIVQCYLFEILCNILTYFYMALFQQILSLLKI